MKQQNDIPKIAFFYWGGESLPYLRYLTLYSFRKYNPDWRMILYVPKEVQLGLSWTSSEHKRINIKQKDYSSRLDKLNLEIKVLDMTDFDLPNDISEVHKSDFIRWYLLDSFGGLWSDMDILYFKPISSILKKNMSNYVCYFSYYWSIGFMLSSANNLYNRNIFSEAKKSFNPNQYQSLGSLLVKKNYKDFNDAVEKHPDLNFYNLSMNVVYPIVSSRIGLVYEKNNLDLLSNKNTIGLHWYAGAKSSSWYVNNIESTTDLQKMNNSFSKVLQRVVYE